MPRLFLRPDLDPPVTRDSVMAALMAQQMERERIRRETGVVIGPNGVALRDGHIRAEGALK